MQNLLQLMDEAYTGSTIVDRGGDSGDENIGSRDDMEALFLDLLKDENDGLTVSFSFIFLIVCVYHVCLVKLLSAVNCSERKACSYKAQADFE